MGSVDTTGQGRKSCKSVRNWACIAGVTAILLTASVAAQTTVRDVASWDTLVGQYRLEKEPEIVWSFSHEGEHFYLESARIPRHELTSSGPLRFADGNAEYVFTASSQQMRVSLERKELYQPVVASALKINDEPVHRSFPHYDRQEVMIPMPDGVRLHTIILRPESSTPLPFLMTRTPYGVSEVTSDSLNTRYTELARSGYIFVFQDIRGRYGSEGEFVHLAPLVDHHDRMKADESTDAYNTAEWLLNNVPHNNGRIGVFGISYPGFTALEAGINAHPAIRAISPQAPAVDQWMGDDYFHNGAFRQSYGLNYVMRMERSKQQTPLKTDEDNFTYFLRGGTFESLVKQEGADTLPTSRGFLEHPAYDEYWQKRAVQKFIADVRVPTLLVGGVWDQEDLWGPQAVYATWKEQGKPNNYLVLGPWYHGQWGITTRNIGAIDLGSATTDYFREELEARFFDHFLKDKSDAGLGQVTAFQTGSNIWRSYRQWPPQQAQQRNLYLTADGQTSFHWPSATNDTGFIHYVSDPQKPVPYRTRPIPDTYDPRGSGWPTWLVQDQSFLKGRKDIASWTSETLDKDLTITGDVLADIFASTTGTDADWVVKLIDVYPDGDVQKAMNGYELMINAEIFRGRYVHSFEHPQPLKANRVQEYRFSLYAANHVFRKGHRIMVQIQSTWFPLYDRNPQKYVYNIMKAKPEDFTTAEQRVFCSAEYPSHIVLPVVP